MVLACCCSCSPTDEEPRPRCIELSPSCTPLYTPSFDELFTRTLMPTCGQGGSSCHGPDGAKGGLVFAEADTAYALLTGQSGAKPRVVAGDPGCSEIVVRTHRAGEPWSMPPGQPLSENERCVIRQWIEQGAVR
jgi:hypothetical protein